MRKVERIGTTKILGREIVFYGDWENPLFLGGDVAGWIDHSDVSTLLRRLEVGSEKVTKGVRTNGGSQQMIFLTEDGVRRALANSRKPKAKELLSQIEDSWRYINMPKETEFALMLRNMLEIHEMSFAKFNGDCNYIPLGSNNLIYPEYLKFEEQYKVLDYHVDFYFPKLMLVVEYDEKYHANQKEEDKKRMDKIVDELAKGHESYGMCEIPNEEIIKVVRVKEGEDFEGLVEILTCITSVFV